MLLGATKCLTSLCADTRFTMTIAILLCDRNSAMAREKFWRLRSHMALWVLHAHSTFSAQTSRGDRRGSTRAVADAKQGNNTDRERHHARMKNSLATHDAGGIDDWHGACRPVTRPRVGRNRVHLSITNRLHAMDLVMHIGVPIK